jgi:hypothetical protein
MNTLNSWELRCRMNHFSVCMRVLTDERQNSGNSSNTVAELFIARLECERRTEVTFDKVTVWHEKMISRIDQVESNC